MLFLLLNTLMVCLFLFAAGVQHNDPDSLRWIAIYLAAALVGCWVFIDRVRWPVPALVAAVALAWAASLAPGVAGRVGDLFAEWEMANPAVEVTREVGGLLIVAAWMAVVAAWAYRRRRTGIARGS